MQVHFAPACEQDTEAAKSFPSLRSPPVRRAIRHFDFQRGQSQVPPSLRFSSILPLSASTSSTSGNSSGPSSIDSSLLGSGSQEESEEQETNGCFFERNGPRDQEERDHRNSRIRTASSLSSECGRLSRSSSASTLREDWSQQLRPDHPDLSELGSIADLSAKFTSLTAKKLMAGISIGSIDTLIEVNSLMDSELFCLQVNAAANNNNNNNIKMQNNNSVNRDNQFNESRETVDFGVI